MTVDLSRDATSVTLRAFVVSDNAGVLGLSSSVSISDPIAGLDYDWSDGTFKASPVTASQPGVELGEGQYTLVWDTSAATLPASDQVLLATWTFSGTVNVTGIEDIQIVTPLQAGVAAPAPVPTEPPAIFAGEKGNTIRLPTGQTVDDLVGATNVTVLVQRRRFRNGIYPDHGPVIERPATIAGTDVLYPLIADDGVFDSCGDYKVQGAYDTALGHKQYTDAMMQPVLPPLEVMA